MIQLISNDLELWMRKSYFYEFITNIGSDWEKLESKELKGLAPIWVEQAMKLKESRSLKDFNLKLSREWAIETGIIENLYTLDRGITQLLIERGFEASLIPHGTTDKSPEEVVSIIKDQESALEGLFQLVTETRDLSTSYIKQLHQKITNSQTEVIAVDQFGNKGSVELQRGVWKNHPNNPTRIDGGIHEYCPPEHVAAEMDLLISFYNKNVEDKVSPEVLAAWLHHRFTQIHPFQDGNGRIARAIASLVFIKAQWFPLVITREVRSEYIDSLEKADDGDLEPLVQLFTRLQKKAFLRALSLSQQILEKEEPVVHQVISSAIERIRDRKAIEYDKLTKVFTYGDSLQEIIVEKLEPVKNLLGEQLKELDEHYSTFLDTSTERNNFWFRFQIIDTARSLDYFADTRTFRKWVRLKILEERKSEMVFSIHSVGTDFVGVLAVSAFIFFKDTSEDPGMVFSDTHPLCTDLFQFSYNEDFEIIKDRFSSWVDKVIITGAEEWRRQL